MKPPRSIQRPRTGQNSTKQTRILLVLAFCLLLFVTIIWLAVTPVYAQDSGEVQELTGRIDPGGRVTYWLPGLVQGETLYFYLSATSGNLDPVLALTDATNDIEVLRETFSSRVRTQIEEGADPVVAITEVANELFLAMDDDSGEGYAAALEFPVPADGDYLVSIGANPTQDTFGDYRLLVGLDSPAVLTGDAEPTGDVIAIRDEETTSAGMATQQVTGTLTAEKRSTFFNLNDMAPGDTLYVFAEATSGNLAPVAILEDFGGKPVRSGNFLGEETQATLEYTFDDFGRNYRLSISGCCEEERTTVGDYRLLVGVNTPEVLTGLAETAGEPVIREPIEVQVGIRMQQITGVDQKAENFGVVVTMQMMWQDPRLAFSPDTCQCPFKTFNGSAFINFATDNGITWPEFTLFNQQGRRDTQNQVVVVWPNGEALYFERFSATLQAPDFDFRRFPFDTQQFFIRVDSIFPEEFFLFADLEGFSKLGEQLGEEEWIITDFDTTISSETASTRGPSSRFSFGFQATRHISFYITRFFLPILIILIVSWFTFFLKDYGKRVDVSAGNLLLFIAFNFTISGDLPRLGYLTFMDVILISTFAVTGLVVIFNVILRRLELAGKEDLAHRIDKYTIWIYPVSYVAAVALVTYLFT